jgi:hypothetical protein
MFTRPNFVAALNTDALNTDHRSEKTITYQIEKWSIDSKRREPRGN